MKLFKIVFTLIYLFHLPLYASEPVFKKKSIKEMREVTVESLKDPLSSQFRKEKFKPEATIIDSEGKRKVSILCGEINSKNSYGAYVGFKKFISLSDAYGSIGNASGSAVYFEAEGLVSGETLLYDRLEESKQMADISKTKLELLKLNMNDSTYKTMSEEDEKKMRNKLFFGYLSDRYCK